LLSEQPEVFLSNARTSRAVGAAVKGGEARKVGPRLYTRNPQPLIRVLDFAQAYAAAIEWSDLRAAERTLEQTNAFLEPEVAEERGLRLELPA
jgi:hypothetical protein